MGLEPGDMIYTGIHILTSTNPEKLVDPPRGPCTEIHILAGAQQADYVGNETDQGEGRGFPIPNANPALRLLLADLNNLFVWGATGDEIYYLLVLCGRR